VAVAEPLLRQPPVEALASAEAVLLPSR
jgi:hypothetical protein